MTAPVVVARGLRKSYGDLTVLDGVDLDVGAGEVLALLGPNGAGKTTTVRILSTLLRPDGGTAHVGRQGRRASAGARCGRRSASPGSSRPSTTCSRASRTCTSWPGWRTWAGPRSAAGAPSCSSCSTSPTPADRVVQTYSGGMRRRLDLAVGLLARPQVVFLDEPTTGPRPAQPQRPVGRDPRRSSRPAPRCCSPRSTSRRPTSWPTASRSSTTVGVIADGTAPRAQAARSARRTSSCGSRTAPTSASPPTAPSPDVRRILADVERRGVDVEHWEVRSPTLDDVFLTLTGRPHRRPTPALVASRES